MTYENVWQDHGLIFHYIGDVDGEEIYQSNHEAIQDQRFGELRYQIVDLLEASSFDCNSEQIKRIVRQDVATAARYPDILVLIITDNDLIHGFARMYEQYAGDQTTWTTEIYDSMDKAEQRLRELKLLAD